MRSLHRSAQPRSPEDHVDRQSHAGAGVGGGPAPVLRHGARGPGLGRGGDPRQRNPRVRRRLCGGIGGVRAEGSGRSHHRHRCDERLQPAGCPLPSPGGRQGLRWERWRGD
nr:hypothetical protein [Azospirillum sp. TSH58]